MIPRPRHRAARLIRSILGAAALAALAVMAAPQPASAAAMTCNPVNVGLFPGQRIHVRCSPGDGAIIYFALRVNDTAEANRMLSVLSTAFALKKKVHIWYDPGDTSGSNVGCDISDCRLITGAMMF